MSRRKLATCSPTRLTNDGLVGFRRLSTADALLPTWSGLSSNADFVRWASGAQVPTLFVELTGNQASFPEHALEMVEALESDDVTHVRVEGLTLVARFGKGHRPGQVWLLLR